MSSWISRTTRNGIEYPSANYWTWNNAGCTTALCLANCTTYAYGRILDAGDPAPVSYGFPDADYWHTDVQNGWTAIPYNFSNLEEGDIVEWSGNGMKHVAVVEKVQNGQFYVSESFYTWRDTSWTLQYICDWMIANYPDNFFWYGLRTHAYNQDPVYILKNPAHHGTSDPSGPFKFFTNKKSKKRRIIHV